MGGCLLELVLDSRGVLTSFLLSTSVLQKLRGSVDQHARDVAGVMALDSCQAEFRERVGAKQAIRGEFFLAWNDQFKYSTVIRVVHGREGMVISAVGGEEQGGILGPKRDARSGPVGRRARGGGLAAVSRWSSFPTISPI